MKPSYTSYNKITHLNLCAVSGAFLHQTQFYQHQTQFYQYAMDASHKIISINMQWDELVLIYQHAVE